MVVAEAIGRDIRTVQRYEAGEKSPNQDALYIMRELFNCEFADLF